jgi:SpoVK/Ycf46/Vps4 family AAA+-type ATPase
MERQILRDANLQIIGYIDPPDPEGRRRALDRHMRTLGYYDPKADMTYDASYRLLGRGDMLSGLIYRG